MTHEPVQLPVGDLCPSCKQPPMWVMGGGTQAWCGNDDCKILTWNPELTMDELLDDANFVDLPRPRQPSE